MQRQIFNGLSRHESAEQKKGQHSWKKCRPEEFSLGSQQIVSCRLKLKNHDAEACGDYNVTILSSLHAALRVITLTRSYFQLGFCGRRDLDVTKLSGRRFRVTIILKQILPP